MSELIEKLKTQLIEQLNLEDLEPGDIDPKAPLFGEEGGIGLDSIDALELIVLLEKEYGIKIKDPKEGKDAFYSLEGMATFIEQHKS